MTTLEISPTEEEEALETIAGNQVALSILKHWDALMVDTTGDAVSEGGQSIAELARLEQFEAFLFTLPQAHIPTFHYFADGIYIRAIAAPKDSVIIGHEHHEEAMNFMLTGRVLTVVNGRSREFAAPFIGKSGKHTRKASIVIEDMIWATVHPNPDNETNIQKLEDRLHIQSPTFARMKEDQ